MNRKSHRAKYILLDVCAAALSWLLFYSYRKEFVEQQKFGFDIPLDFDNRFWVGIVLISCFWPQQLVPSYFYSSNRGIINKTKFPWLLGQESYPARRSKQ